MGFIFIYLFHRVGRAFSRGTSCPIAPLSTLVRVFVTIEKMDKFLMHIIILYVF